MTLSTDLPRPSRPPSPSSPPEPYRHRCVRSADCGAPKRRRDGHAAGGGHIPADVATRRHVTACARAWIRWGTPYLAHRTRQTRVRVLSSCRSPETRCNGCAMFRRHGRARDGRADDVTSTGTRSVPLLCQVSRRERRLLGAVVRVASATSAGPIVCSLGTRATAIEISSATHPR